jgi:hypothetical protein
LVAAERYRQAVEKLAIPHVTSLVERVVTISAGVASLSQLETKSVEAWLNEADAALYRAKQLGRNRIARYEAKSAKASQLEGDEEAHRLMERSQASGKVVARF